MAQRVLELQLLAFVDDALLRHGNLSLQLDPVVEMLDGVVSVRVDHDRSASRHHPHEELQPSRLGASARLGGRGGALAGSVERPIVSVIERFLGGGDAIGVELVALHLLEEIEAVIGGVIVEFSFVVIGER